MTCEEPFWTNCSFDFDNSQRSKMVESPAAAANAFAQQAAATREGDASGVWGQIIDRLQALINALGMSYDTDTAMGEKASMVRAHARMRAWGGRQMMLAGAPNQHLRLCAFVPLACAEHAPSCMRSLVYRVPVAQWRPGR